MAFGQAAVSRDIGVFEFLFSAEYWTGNGGILTSLWDTVVLCSIVIVVATVIAVPLATALAHFGRGELSVTWIVTLSRAVPTFAIAGLLVPVSLRSGWGFEPWPIFLALLLLALPPIYLNTYTAVKGADRDAVDAARAMGFSERAVLFRVEMVLGTAVILAGVRVAAVQVVATEPIRAFLGGDGLGRYVRDGLGQNNDNLLLAGAILVAGLAALTGITFGLLQRLTLPRGVRRLAARSR
ncbi:MAG: osmoprotectant transport system permease protein [Candidatus Aldehydirespiratoraceae bacterium]|jgi:osmoprotectant transport system permease protein